MAWIESHQSLGTHRKVLELCQLLDIEDTQAIGLLHYFWWWALDNAASGDITGITPDTIAIACHWNHPGQGRKRDSKRLFDALLTANFLELNANKVLIHDWDDYAGKLIKAREIDRIRHRVKHADSTGTPSELRRNSEATVPNSIYIKEIHKEKTENGEREKQPEVSNVFKSYEENIGILTPMVADQLKSLLEDYSEEKINAAIQEAVKSNAKSLRYITKVLENGNHNGGNGKSGRSAWD